MIQRLCLVVCIALTMVSATAVCSARAGKIVFAYPSDYLELLPFYVAQERGMYRDAGVEVVLTRVGAGNTYPALLSGSADIVHSNLVDPMTLRLKGQDVVAIGVFSYNFSTQFVLGKKVADRKEVTSQSPIPAKIAALKGTTISVTGQGAGTDQQLKFLLGLGGLDYQRDVRVTFIREGGAALAALTKGQTDGFIHGSPFFEQAITRGEAIMLFNFAAGDVPEADGYVQNGMVTSRKVLRSKRDDIIAFLKGTTKALRYILDPANTEDVLTIASKYTTNGKTPPGEIRPYFEEIIRNKEFRTSTAISERAFLVSRDFRNAVLRQEGQPPLSVAFGEVVDTELATAAAADANR